MFPNKSNGNYALLGIRNSMQHRYLEFSNIILPNCNSIKSDQIFTKNCFKNIYKHLGF